MYFYYLTFLVIDILYYSSVWIKTYNDLEQEETFEYDEYNRVIKDSIKGKGVTTYSYDLNDNILSKTINEDTTLYEYDLNNRLLKTIYSNGRIIENIYDQKGQVIEVHDGLMIVKVDKPCKVGEQVEIIGEHYPVEVRAKELNLVQQRITTDLSDRITRQYFVDGKLDKEINYRFD